MVYPRDSKAANGRHVEHDTSPKNPKHAKKKKRKKLPPAQVWKKGWKGKKGKKEAKETADDNRSSSTAPDPIIDQQPIPESSLDVDVIPEEFVFDDIKLYRLARALFPLSHSSASPSKAFAAQDIDHKASLRFNDIIKVLTSPPLSCELQDLEHGVSFKVYRPARSGLQSAGVTLHKPHGRNPRVERHVLAHFATSLELAFGWRKQHFKLLGAAESDHEGQDDLDNDADDEMDEDAEENDEGDTDDGIGWPQYDHDMEMSEGFW
jgi:hypothetical protein